MLYGLVIVAFIGAWLYVVESLSERPRARLEHNRY